MKTVEQARASYVDAETKDDTLIAIEALIDAKIAAAARAEKDRRHAFLAGVRADAVDAFLPMETEGNPIDDLTCPHCAGSGHKGDVRATPEDTAKGGDRDAFAERLAEAENTISSIAGERDYYSRALSITLSERDALRSTLAKKDRRIGELEGRDETWQHRVTKAIGILNFATDFHAGGAAGKLAREIKDVLTSDEGKP